MAIIDSQLSVTSLDVGLASSTSETDNKNGFLAVLTSVQNEADAKQRAAENEQTDLLGQDGLNDGDFLKLEDFNESDKDSVFAGKDPFFDDSLNEVSVSSDTLDADSIVQDKVNKSEQKEPETKEDKSELDKKITSLSDRYFSQDDVSITRSKDFQQLSGLAERSGTDQAMVNSPSRAKPQPLSEEDTKVKVSGVNEAAQKGSPALQTADNAEAYTEDTSSFLEQLAKSQSLNVELSKTTNDQPIDQQAINSVTVKTIDKGEPKSDPKLTQNIASLDKELEKLDKEVLSSLKQLFTQLNDENSEQLALSKQEIRQVLDKLNSALENIDKKSSKQTVTLQSVLTKSIEGSEQPESVKNDGEIKLSENTKSSLTQLVDDGKIVISSGKFATITRPDNQIPHSLSEVAQSVTQANVGTSNNVIYENDISSTTKKIEQPKSFHSDINFQNKNSQLVNGVSEKLSDETISTELSGHKTLETSAIEPLSGLSKNTSGEPSIILKEFTKRELSDLPQTKKEKSNKDSEGLVKALTQESDSPDNSGQLAKSISKITNDELGGPSASVSKASDTQNAVSYPSFAINQMKSQKPQLLASLENKIRSAAVNNDQLQQENEFNFGDQAIEQSMRFSKLLNALKSNANTPVLSQLVSQIQSSQLQQAELRDVNQQHIELQTAQVMQNTKEVSATAEQVLQQPINIARNDAAKALFDKANMLLNLNLREAEIRLDPPELGSMQIRIRSDAEQAQINFVVQSQQAKEMLEQSMGRLKEMLAEQGINLGESSVSEQGQNEQQMAEQSNSPLGVELSADDSVELSEQILSKQQDGIDFYA